MWLSAHSIAAIMIPTLTKMLLVVMLAFMILWSVFEKNLGGVNPGALLNGLSYVKLFRWLLAHMHRFVGWKHVLAVDVMAFCFVLNMETLALSTHFWKA